MTWADVFYWTGAAAWAVVGVAFGWVAYEATRQAFKSAWFVFRIYRHGWLLPSSGGLGLGYPFRIWWVGFWDNGIECWTRKQDGIVVYWPGREPKDDADD